MYAGYAGKVTKGALVMLTRDSYINPRRAHSGRLVYSYYLAYRVCMRHLHLRKRCDTS